MSSTPTWLVTGANGFLGANMGASLAGRAHRVGAVRSARDGDDLFDEYVAADLEDPATLVRAIEDRRPDVIVHSAAIASHEACEDDPQRARLVNTTASEALARTAASAGSRFVLISTDAVFDGSRGHYAEDDAPRPTSVYGRTKVEAEQAVLDATDALVVRTNFFGWSPTGRRSILEFFVNALSQGQQVRGFTDFTTSSAYAQVLAQTMWDLMAIDASGIVHVTSPDAMTKYAFGVAVAEEFGLDPGLITPTRSDIQPPREGDISLDVSRLQALLGRTLPTMEEGIRLAHADAATLRRTIAGTPEP
jgi:dTDP-4-dehydrorhamnose reductase